ncbi:Ethanolamine ammonia-lyase light chain [Rhodoblastus acidophilus]|uniref:Ethanolamine ammonia-lyase small subunit n=1 Tax=Rhodoblastus acidophilus TaxID=1074 RepID=A0A212QKB6_RHOAC|nr:ethanolamine ammonia-lyase subunit EutC [Rhodoblastus acidophilus]PPQ39940.1 ethanolamine ammonia-lyase subunit EutC [Rhodoblastus acidophilus]RAI23286.1 ethanolamine ammonia-lyase [Rhodoblastus acidophilus]SNB59667.1 Ethanolamine ammonia-lyase light chain [Rhodoblastus acidophilus]
MNDVIKNPWGELRRLTAARIALGRVGTSLPTAAHLDFQYDHARARDAVHRPLDAEAVAAGLRAQNLDVLRVHSAAPDRATYLQRPDLGRRLDDASRVLLHPQPCDLAFVVADGLSSFAIENHAAPFLATLLPMLKGFALGPVALALQGRVALGDEIGALLQAKIVVVLIGERPGLSSPDSMGLYLTWAPEKGRTDADRNCISNIRPEGLAYEAAARKTLYLLGEARRLSYSGVRLKDETDANGLTLARESRPELSGA